ncbi:hypothetical protein MIND_01297800 [Mycena indigotica]|uniref:Actin-like ATPase domain-containing protein n=1 Tax=Mycena indigotica TaxID=2126181 RepID=A0A8H6S2D1_9AGAR|nr:uncharacterized protein MIND_01297800 [Mycena indigotica]KAF7290577.1 hypothetical protein MIND_01297800 [Mycena indigotica]
MAMNMHKRRPPYKGTEMKLVLAIDIGTTFSAASWCLLEPKKEPKMGGVQQWPKQSIPDSKVPTLIFYDKNGIAQAFGAAVEDEGVMKEAVLAGWLRVEWFKLHLRPASLKFIDPFHTLPPLPANVSIKQLYTDFLRFVGDQVKVNFLASYSKSESFWNKLLESMDVVLSIPNGWEGPQQEQMRRAAIGAGLVDAHGADRVKFVSEAEASVLYAIETGRITDWLTPSAHIVICDCGGGTVDITRYCVKSNYPCLQLEESALPRCYMAGSLVVTDYAREYLSVLSRGTDWEEKTEAFEMVVSNFDKLAKVKFSQENENSYVRLGGFETCAEKDIERGQLKLSGDKMALFFQPCIEHIQNGIKSACFDSDGKLVTAQVILVGGFAGSPYLFSQLNQFAKEIGVEITRPDGPTAKAVVNGSISWFLDSTVRARLAKWHYGTDVFCQYDSDIPGHLPYKDQIITVPSGIQYIPRAWQCIAPMGARLSTRKEHCVAFVAELPDDTVNFIREETIYIYRAQTPPSFMCEPDESDFKPDFEAICTIKGNLRKCFKATPPQTSSLGHRFRRIEFEVALRLGGTQLSARLKWKENGKYKEGPATVIITEFN